MKIRKHNIRRSASSLSAILGLVFAWTAQGSVVYQHAPTPIASMSSVNSNAVVLAEGSDQDVTAYDNFTLAKSASITSVT